MGTGTGLVLKISIFRRFGRSQFPFLHKLLTAEPTMQRLLATCIPCTLAAVILWSGTQRVCAAESPAAGIEFFEKKIRPLLVDNCFKCHGNGKKKGNLQLDSRASLLKGGDSGPAIVPGQPEQSLLIKAIGYQDDMLRMPPRGKLADQHIAELSAWIKMGAPWPEDVTTRTAGLGETFDMAARRRHWCWQPLQARTPPAVKQAGWPQSPIDHFVLAKLEANGLAPAKPADRRTLIRRVTYDLIGLPPTPAEIDAFLTDDSPDAYAKVVDRLLASPHYGERWGRHWLDLVRFAETYGHEFDYDIPEAYRYRDYVIRAFNDDVPYDQFVTEHIAGDLLPEPRRHAVEHFNESILGTGFWFLGEMVHSPVDVRADEAERIDNQIDVLGKAFLGLTLACARCHDHKFDAITTRDYYALSGYLQSSRLQRTPIDAAARRLQTIDQLKALNTQATPIAISAAATQLRKRAENLAHYLLSAKGQKETVPDHDPLYPWVRLPGMLQPEQFIANRQTLVQRLKDGAAQAGQALASAAVFEDFQTDTFQNWFVSGEAFGTGPTRGVQPLLSVDDGSVRTVVPPGVAHSGLVSDKLQGVLRSQSFVISRKKILYHAAGRQAQINLIIDGYQLIRDPIYGGLTIKIDQGDDFQWHAQDVSMWLGHRAYIELIDNGPGYIAVDKIVFSDERPPADAPNPLLVSLLDDPRLTSRDDLARKYQGLFLEIVGQWQDGNLAAQADGKERLALLNWLLHHAALARQLDPPPEHGELAGLVRRGKELEAALSPVQQCLAMGDGTGWNDHVHIRGNPNRFGEEVPRRFLEAIAGRNQPCWQRGSGRLELARRMTDRSDALLPRVMVNRIWQHHFGAAIVRSPDNFGALGEWPTHPELLDYLATEFVRRGWSIKAMHRLMLLSSTYQMASRSEEASEARDPQNKMWHRMPLQRLEAECIRDALLAVSGQLHRTLYGPSVPPYLTPHMSGRGRPAQSGPLDGNGRRSIYLNVRRNFLTPLFLAFDYPIPFTTIGRRSVSNVPAQALALMNNPLITQQAERWARRTLARARQAPRERISDLYVMAFGRPPDEREMTEALDFLEEQGKHYNGPGDPQAWRDLCHVLFNVKEFIFIN
jgi:cytochrome c553